MPRVRITRHALRSVLQCVLVLGAGSAAAVLPTDLDDAECRQNPGKIGPDADGKAGGCHNVRVTIEGSGTVNADYWRGSD